MVVGIPKDQPPDQEASLLQPDQAASKEVDSVADLADAVTAVDSVADSVAVIEEASEAGEEEASDTSLEAVSAEEVGMVEGMVTAQHHPLMLLQVQAEEAEAVLAVHKSLLLSMVLRARTAILVGMALHVAAHMTTDLLIVAEAVVEVGLVIAAPEASLAVIASPSDPVTEVIGIGIDTAAEDETTTMGAGRGIMMAMAMMIHAANGDISRLRRTSVCWVGLFPISAFPSPLLPG